MVHSTEPTHPVAEAVQGAPTLACVDPSIENRPSPVAVPEPVCCAAALVAHTQADASSPRARLVLGRILFPVQAKAIYHCALPTTLIRTYRRQDLPLAARILPSVKTMFLAGSLLLLSSVAAVAAPSTSSLTDALEVRAVEAIADRYEDDLRLLVETVNINSGTLNTAGVREVGEVLAREFEELGFTIRWIEGDAFDRAGHLIAEHAPDPAASDAIHVLLIGHLDTVFEPDSPFQQMQISENSAHGPGAVDMKGGNVVMLSALHGLQAAGILADMRITVFLAGDEERVGNPLEVSRAELRRLAGEADVTLGFEDGDGDPSTAVISRRGSSRWELGVTGNRAHSSQVFQPEVGAGAIHEAARVIDAFRNQLSVFEDLSYSPGLVLGGTKVEFDPTTARGKAFGKNNVVPQTAVVTGDIRATSPEQLAAAQAVMEEVASASLPGTSTEFVLEERYPPMAASEGNRRLLAIYDRASRDLGTGRVTAVDPRKAGAADVAFVAAHVDMALDGLGLMGTGGHSVDETADLTTLSSQAARAAVTMLRLHREYQP